MVSESFRFAQLICWVLPATVAGWNWGMPVALLTFGAQMFSAPPLTRMYYAYRASRGSVDPEDIQRFNLMANVLTGTLYAFLSKLIVDGSF